MKIQNNLQTPKNRAQAFRESSTLPKDTVTLGQSEEAPPEIPSPHKPSGTPWTTRLLAGVGLGAVALSLVGCTGGGGDVPKPPDSNQNQQQTQASTATSLTQRLEQLRSSTDKTGYISMSEAGYYDTLLRSLAGDTNPAVKDLAAQATEVHSHFDFKGDPAAQQKATRSALEAVAKTESKDPVVGKYVEAAKAALAIGDAFRTAAPNAPSGIMAQLKNNGYEMGFQKAIEQLRLAPDRLKESSGMDPAVVRNYAESLTLTAQNALDFAKELKDPSMAAVLYQSTGDSLYGRVKTDGQFLGTQVTTALELIQKARQGLGF